ncbi:MAG: DUF2996 domain-containing protein [Cyanobacteria bacterium]|nr:DUF2996 domain-containing protein [Cyanobacteriota bacterium]MDW8203141.1 DUF2996 domain-containing protein [Cyanobacteriota bacterium SKYGB_h_bin112]
MSDETAKQAPAASEEESAATPAAAKPKKEKPPAPEDKPFAEFIQQDYIPALQTALAQKGIQDISISLEHQAIPVVGVPADPCWQVVGRWQQSKRQFNLYFPNESIQGFRGFSCADNGTKPAVLEPFLCDERKITLDLLVAGLVQRLNGQKWLTRN